MSKKSLIDAFEVKPAPLKVEDINAPIPRTVRLKSVLTKVYPDSILDDLLTGVQKLKILSTNQYSNGDYIGNDITFEDELFPDDLSFAPNFPFSI